MRKIFSANLIILGIVGLCVSFFGELTGLGDYESAAPRSWEQFGPQLVKETPGLAFPQRKINFLSNQPQNKRMTQKYLAYRAEKIANVLKWGFPVILMIMGFGLYLKNSKENICAV